MVAHGIVIMSVFGPLEAEVAEAMIEEGKAFKLPVKDFPAEAPKKGENDEPVLFGLGMPPSLADEFHERVKKLTN